MLPHDPVGSVTVELWLDIFVTCLSSTAAGLEVAPMVATPTRGVMLADLASSAGADPQLDSGVYLV